MMDRIVFGFANITFQHNIAEFPDENRTPNRITMSLTGTQTQSDETPKDIHNDSVSSVSLSDNPEDDDANWEDTGDQDTDWRPYGKVAPGQQRSGFTLSERRQMPTRKSKDNSLCGIKRRTIMKPTKRINLVHKDSLTPSEVKKIYLNKKLTKFRPASLETIVEELSEDSQGDEEGEATKHEVGFIGSKKLRRALKFRDFSVKLDKSIIKKRRAKIRQVIGRRPATKKISLEEFISRLNKSMEENKSIDTPAEHMDEGYCQNLETVFSQSNNAKDSITCSLAPEHDGGEMTEVLNVLPSNSTRGVI